MIRNSISRSKKGFFGPAITIVIALFIMGLLAIVSYNIFTDLNSDIQADADISTDAKAMSSSLHARFPSTMDGAFLFVFILLWILLLVSIWFFDSNPLFAIIVLIVLIILLIAAGMFSNFWEEMATTTDFDFASSFPSTYFILNNFLLVMSVVSISAFITLYMKSR